MKAIIIDDEELSRKTLYQLLENYCPEVQVLAEAESADSGYDLIVNKEPDIVFLDIEMPYGSGFDLLKRFDNLNFEVIFVTAYDQYALKAIKSCALDYILKPININELKEAVEKALQNKDTKSDSIKLNTLLQNLSNTNAANARIALPTNEGFEFLKVSEITRCEADGRYTFVFLSNGTKILVAKNLKEFEFLLEDHDFIRVHHSHLINMAFIRKYHKADGGYLTMDDGATVMISRRKKDQFLERFIKK